MSEEYPHTVSREERVAGALMGFLIGDAMGLGTHWYYDRKDFEKDFGLWVDDYQNPAEQGNHSFKTISKFRYQQGVRAGDVSQTGQIFALLLESVTEKKSFAQADFHQRLDGFFKTLNGESYSGRYTESIIKELWHNQKKGVAWSSPEMATASDTSDGAQFSVVLAALYKDPLELAEAADRLMKPFFNDRFIRQNQVVYALTLQAVIAGTPLRKLKEYMVGLLQNPDLKVLMGGYDNIHTVTNGAVAWKPEVRIEPAHYVGEVYGLDCQLTHLLPAVYYLIHRFPADYTQGMLAAVNSGGNNMARAAMTSALLGAMNGLGAIPKKYIDGLKDHNRYLQLSRELIKVRQSSGS
ncbi:ADP-ribosylglycohydrolase family protein [Endozoicomonas sp. OPT23]|uniref:ADP-ribosylglycohydrolase family protein n=1 Tax=Endozoicomonas sp. OPT23 TaxID=2072845 RepID=UPI001890CC9F|nr:ADP-ribosylglycohydrolase family protein [Endozoicomonas sp. OPT23]